MYLFYIKVGVPSQIFLDKIFYLRYNCLGQLVCTICNTALKSSLLWNAHLQGRQHKEVQTIMFLSYYKTCFHLNPLCHKVGVQSLHDFLLLLSNCKLLKLIILIIVFQSSEGIIGISFQPKVDLPLDKVFLLTTNFLWKEYSFLI